MPCNGKFNENLCPYCVHKECKHNPHSDDSVK